MLKLIKELFYCLEIEKKQMEYKNEDIMITNNGYMFFRCLYLFVCCQRHATGRWFSPGTPVSSTNKTDRHDIAEILLKVALNTRTQHPLYTSFSVTSVKC